MAGTLKSHSAAGILAEDDSGHVLLAFGTSVPADGNLGYATGCLFFKTNGGAGTALYCNEGTADSANFDAVTVA